MSLVTDDFAPYNVLNDRGYYDIRMFPGKFKNWETFLCFLRSSLIRWSIFARDFYNG